MLRLVILFVLTVSFNYHVAASPSWLSQHGLGVHGGDPIKIEKAPFMATYRPTSKTWWCGASIINEKFLVTSARCISESKPSEVLVGTDNIKSGGTTFEVESFFRHPNYNSMTLDSDIAVIKLKNKFEFNDKVKPIEIVDADVTIEAGELMTTMGFGKTEKNELSNVLLSVDAPYFDQQKCKDKLNGLTNNITHTMLCAGGEKNKGPCDGDVGAPIILKGKLAGTMSFGCFCGREGYPMVYSRLSVLRQWIDDTVKENSD